MKLWTFFCSSKPPGHGPVHHGYINVTQYCYVWLVTLQVYIDIIYYYALCKETHHYVCYKDMTQCTLITYCDQRGIRLTTTANKIFTVTICTDLILINQDNTLSM